MKCSLILPRLTLSFLFWLVGVSVRPTTESDSTSTTAFVLCKTILIHLTINQLHAFSDCDNRDVACPSNLRRNVVIFAIVGFEGSNPTVAVHLSC